MLQCKYRDEEKTRQVRAVSRSGTKINSSDPAVLSPTSRAGPLSSRWPSPPGSPARIVCSDGRTNQRILWPGAVAEASQYTSAMKKPLRCWLTFHDWRLMVNDEGQQYKTCTRCGAYRDFDPRPGG
jgi:hypothetical protein